MGKLKEIISNSSKDKRDEKKCQKEKKRNVTTFLVRLCIITNL